MSKQQRRTFGCNRISQDLKTDFHRHFASLQNTGAFPNGMNNDVFLVVNGESVQSYSKENKDTVRPFGDRGGYVLAVDAAFNPHVPDPRAFEHPGYKGQMHILSPLIFPDLYPLLTSGMQGLKDFWPLAAGHPLQVYVGPTVGVQHDLWEEGHQMKTMLTGGFFDFWRKKEQEGTF
jgi:hypothetical protein